MLGQARGRLGIERVEVQEVDVSYSGTVGMLRDKSEVRRDPRWRVVVEREEREARTWQTHRHGT